MCTERGRGERETYRERLMCTEGEGRERDI